MIAVLILGWFSSDLPIESVAVSPKGALFSQHDACNWWSGEVQYDVAACDTFSITRVNPSSVEQAMDRATRCALAGTTECVLNGEIGFNIPSVFVYDEVSAGLKMLIAPRILPIDADARTVRMMDPTGELPNQVFTFNNTVKVEYLVGGARALETREFKGNAAYCIQALRRSISPACWAGLD